MSASETVPALLADLSALLDHVGERGLPLTDTGRLRLTDVRTINARFVAPEELERRYGDHTVTIRREDDAWRVHFLRLAAQAAGLVDARLGRAHRTARARTFARLPSDDALGRLFVAWWWKGAWDLIAAGNAAESRLVAERLATANALVALETGQHTLARLGVRVRDAVAPGVGPSVHPAFSDEAWAFATWRLCLEPLTVFDGAVPVHDVEMIGEHSFEELAAVRVTDAGQRLLRAALDAAPAERPRVRRGMNAPFPGPRRPTNASGRDRFDTVDDDLRRERILDQHPPLMPAAFVDAALRPMAGRAELPARVLVRPELAAALRDALGSLDIAVEEAEELPFAHAALDSSAGFLADPGSRRERRARKRRRR